MILKLQTLLRKSDARGAYGLKGRCVCGAAPLAAPFVRPFVWPFATGVAPFMGTSTISELVGSEAPFVQGHMLCFCAGARGVLMGAVESERIQWCEVRRR